MRILQGGRDIMESGIDTQPGQEIKDVTIVIGTAAKEGSATESKPAPAQDLRAERNTDQAKAIAEIEKLGGGAKDTIPPSSPDKSATKEHWSLTLKETLLYALQNSKVMRQSECRSREGRRFLRRVLRWHPPLASRAEPRRASTKAYSSPEPIPTLA